MEKPEKLTDKQLTKINKEVSHALDFVAREIVGAVVENTTDEQTFDSQRIYDMVVDHLDQYNLNHIVKKKLKEKMGVK
jgi:hypothetical protein